MTTRIDREPGTKNAPRRYHANSSRCCSCTSLLQIKNIRNGMFAMILGFCIISNFYMWQQMDMESTMPARISSSASSSSSSSSSLLLSLPSWLTFTSSSLLSEEEEEERRLQHKRHNASRVGEIYYTIMVDAANGIVQEQNRTRTAPPQPIDLPSHQQQRPLNKTPPKKGARRNIPQQQQQLQLQLEQQQRLQENSRQQKETLQQEIPSSRQQSTGQSHPIQTVVPSVQTVQRQELLNSTLKLTKTAGIGHPPPPGPKTVRNTTTTTTTTSSINNNNNDTAPMTIPFRNTTDTSKFHFLTKALLKGEKVFLYQRNQMTGFGSVMLTFFMFCIYYEEHHDRRTAILDDTFSQTYRKSKEVGLQGFLNFNFHVMNTPEEYQRVFQELKQVQMGHLTNEDDWVEHMWNETTTKDYPVLRIRQFKDPRYFQDKRKEIFGLYKYGGNDPRMFERISQRICDNVSFNDELLRDVHVILRNASIPDYAYSVQANLIFDHHNTNTNNNTNYNINPSTPSSSSSTPSSPSPSPSLGPTVAFHVRRGDKVHGKRTESRLYLEDMYVDTMLQIPDIPLQDIQHCYVATDEYNVTLGLKESLLQRNITCQLHYLVPPNRDKDNLSDRHSQDDTKMFFTELYMLTHATYFVGTFNSNVGAFVAAFRRCHWEGGIGSMSDRYHHFFHSYGVDRENWFIRK